MSISGGSSRSLDFLNILPNLLLRLHLSIMGVPYSKEIHYAFDQVTPLVACGFRVLETSRDIAIVMALIQALTGLLLVSILLAALALLITVNPDLELERQEIVTPAMKWLAGWVMHPEDRKWLEIALLVILGGLVLGTWAGFYVMRDSNLIVQGGTGDEVADEVLEGTDSG